MKLVIVLQKLKMTLQVCKGAYVWFKLDLNFVHFRPDIRQMLKVLLATQTPTKNPTSEPTVTPTILPPTVSPTLDRIFLDANLTAHGYNATTLLKYEDILVKSLKQILVVDFISIQKVTDICELPHFCNWRIFAF